MANVGNARRTIRVLREVFLITSICRVSDNTTRNSKYKGKSFNNKTIDQTMKCKYALERKDAPTEKQEEKQKIGEAMRKRNQLQLKLNNRSNFQRSNDEHGPTKIPNIVYSWCSFNLKFASSPTASSRSPRTSET